MKIDDFLAELDEGEKDTGEEKVLVLIIYDIVENAKRVKFAKFLQGYGTRVQKSAFEARITRKKYEKMIREIPKFCSKEDSIKVYKIIGTSQVRSWGIQNEIIEEDIIII